MKLQHKIVSIILALAIFNFNLVILPVQAEGCHCEHPHGDNGFACFCGKSVKKEHCKTQGPALSKGHCGLDKKSNDFSIPAHEHPSLLSVVGTNLNPYISTLKTADINAIYGTDMPPIERPPSIL